MFEIVSNSPKRIRRWTTGPLLMLTVIASPISSLAQQRTLNAVVPPSVFDFDIPVGRLQPGGNIVEVRTDDGQKVNARVHIGVGSHSIVMLPDGQLIARRKDQTRPADAAFAPIDKDALAEQLLSGPFEGFQSRQTRRYLYVYNTSETFCAVASRILETMLPDVVAHAKAQKIDVREPEVPLVVVMFRDEKQYRRATGAPEGMSAFYSAVDNRVSMFENRKLAYDRADLAVQEALATIAHEGAHQILHNIGVQQRLSVWPMWLSEGLAEYFAPTSTDARLRYKGAGQVNDLRMFELEQYFKSRQSEGDGDLIRHTVGAARLTSTGYASSWALTYYLAKNDRASFNRFVNEVSGLRPLEGDLRIVKPGIVPGNLSWFEDFFGDDFALLEKRLVAQLNRLPYNDPFADAPHFLGLVSARVDGRIQRDANIFRTQVLARRWCEEVIEALPEAIRDKADFEVQRAANKLEAQRRAARWVRGR